MFAFTEMGKKHHFLFPVFMVICYLVLFVTITDSIAGWAWVACAAAGALAVATCLAGLIEPTPAGELLCIAAGTFAIQKCEEAYNSS